MRLVKFAVPALVVGAGLLVSSSTLNGKPADTKATGQKCTVCHTTAKGGKADLTDVGKYYKEKKSLDGYAGPGADKIVKKK